MAQTATMRAAVIDAFGPPDVLHTTRLPVPVPGDGEVLVRVHAAGLNAIDWMTRAGHGVEVRDFPAVLGWDICGTVVATGPNTTGLREGDEVFGLPGFPELAGGYAEYVTAPADSLAIKPGGVDHRTAAGAPMVGLTAWQAIFQNAGLTSGQRVLIHGAAGGVGHVAVQLAKLTDAEVIGTASTRNHDFVIGLGAHRVIDYTKERIEDSVKNLDVVIDSRGGEDFVRLLDVLRPGGIIVTLKGRDPSQQGIVKARGLRVGYTYVGPDGAALAQVAKLIAEDKLHIEVEQVFSLGEAAAAHAIGERGHVRGRLILDIT